MTWIVVLGEGALNVALPNGLRYQGPAEVVLSDEHYSQLSAAAVSTFSATSDLGGIVSYEVTVAAGVSGCILPDGLLHSAGDVVILADWQYSLLTPGAVSTLISSIVPAAG